MKSTDEQMKTRGFVVETEQLSAQFDKQRTIAELTSSSACQRTLAARALGQRWPKDQAAVQGLCQQLIREKKLYSKIEICQALSKGGGEAVQQLLPLLGTIGNNQLRELHQCQSSKKKSYPLARDIVARILAQMPAVYFEQQLEGLKHVTAVQGQELLDSLGYHLFYHPELATDEVYQTLYAYAVTYQSEAVVGWKFLTVCSGFSNQQCGIFLTSQLTHEAVLYRQEAQRSLLLQRQ